MTRTRLLILVIVALIGLLLALWASYAQRPRDGLDSQVQQLLLPGLREDINQLQQVKIIGAANQVLVTLRRSDSGWQIEERDDWPANRAQLRILLLGLADARLLQPRTTQMQHYAALGVEDVDDVAASGIALELLGPNEPITLIVGHLDARQQGTFVRRSGELQSWLVSGAISASRRPADWLDEHGIEIDPREVASMQLLGADGDVFIHREAPAHGFVIDSLPNGRVAAAEHVLQSFASALDSLRLQDIQSRRDPPANGLVNAHFTTFDGLVVTVQGWRENGRAFVNIDASSGQPVQSDAAANDSEGPAEELVAQTGAGQGEYNGAPAHQRAEGINAQLGRHTLVVPPFQLDALDRSLNDLSTTE